MSDGPVTARVRIDGAAVPCDPAWVVVGPPSYAPDLKSVRTMYDLLRSLFVETGHFPEPTTASVRDDILPILTRVTRLQWVNQGFATAYGWHAAARVRQPALVAHLSKPGDEFREFRREVYNDFRVFDRDGLSPVPWPWVYGDAMNRTPVSPRQYSTLSPLQMRLLALWVRGDFVNDFPVIRDRPARRRARRGAAGDVGRGVARLLPGRRFPPRVRDHVADPAHHDVQQTVPYQAPPRESARDGLRVAAHARSGPRVGRPAVRPGSGRPVAVDGGAVADRHGQLP